MFPSFSLLRLSAKFIERALCFPQKVKSNEFLQKSKCVNEITTRFLQKIFPEMFVFQALFGP